MEKFEILLLGFIFGIAVGYFIKCNKNPLSKEEYEERRMAREAEYFDQLEKIKGLEEMDIKLNKIIRR